MKKTEYPAPEADRLNSAEKKEVPRALLLGGQPGRRKRGFHRVVKRREGWALFQRNMLDDIKRWYDSS